jgi:F-type H+-transporting ATPase subunit b
MDETTNTELLDFANDWKSDLAIYTFVVFLLLLLLLWKVAFGPISQALEAREEGIRKDIADAKAEREKAEVLRGQYEGMLEAAGDKVREIFAEANAKAEEMRAKRAAEADQEAQARIQQAIQEIERAKGQAIAELFEMENQRIVQATEHVLGRALSQDDQSRLVNEALAHFSKT